MPGNMKMSLLEMTQNILSAMNSDTINSIGDTPESLQVAEAIKSTYFNMLGRYDMPEHNQLFNLTPSNNVQQPVLMFVPDGVTRIEWLDYYDTSPLDNLQQDQFGAYSHDVNTDLQNNASVLATSTTSNTINTGSVTFTIQSGLPISPGLSLWCIPNSQINFFMFGTVTSYSGTTLVLNITQTNGAGTFNNWTITPNGPASLSIPGYKRVEMLSIEDFLHQTSLFDLSEPNVESFTLTINENTTQSPSVFVIRYMSDRQPKYCCVLSNYYVLFDSFDSTQDSTLQASKTRAFGWVYPTFSMTDTFVPNLDAQQFPLLLNDAKSLAFSEIKNQPHQKAEEEVARQVVSLQKWKAIANKPSYFDELANFGRSGPDWSGGGRLGWR